MLGYLNFRWNSQYCRAYTLFFRRHTTTCNSVSTFELYVGGFPVDQLFATTVFADAKERQLVNEEFLASNSDKDNKDNTCCPSKCELGTLEEEEECASSFGKSSII